MRIGNRLGGVLVWALSAAMSAAAAAHKPPSESRPSPSADRWTGQTGDHFFGVYVPTRFGGELTIKATTGKVVRSEGSRQQAAGPTARTSASISRDGTPSRS